MTSRLLFIIAAAVGVASGARADSLTREDSVHERWLTERMNTAYAVKPGMTAEALSKIFHHASVLAHPNGTYVYLLRGCPLVRLDVTFTQISNGNWTNVVADTWTIATVSKPYLAPIPND